jgi:S-adenosylmethionine decarboxylase
LKPLQHLGYQKTIDFYGCSTEKINSCNYVETKLLEAARLMQLTVVNATIHKFSPIGVSGVIVIEESHIAIHTWPEHHYVALDIFTCNSSYELEKGIDFLTQAFEAQKIEEKDIVRGDLNQVKNLNSSIYEN